MLLRGNTDILRAITGSAADIRPFVTAMQADNAAPPVVQAIPDFGALAAISTATTTNQVDATGLTAGHAYSVKDGSWYNAHATQSTTFKLEVFDGTRTSPVWNGTLLAGEKLGYDETGVWTLYDSNGNQKATVFPAASQAEMEAAVSNTVSVTPANLNWHPAMPKFAVLFTGNSTAILFNWNVTSITDGTTEATVTIGTDFSSANWVCQATAEGASTTVGAARLATCRAIAAGTIVVFCVDGSATTALVDPTRWHVMGIGDQ